MRASLLALLVVPVVLEAQDPSRARVVTGAEFYTMSFDPGTGTKSMREMVVPVGLVLPISPRFSLDVGTYVVSVERQDENGATATISGLTDVIVRGGYQLRQDFATLTFGMSIPTGQGTLTRDQLLAAGTVASDLIPFPVTSFGAGFTATTGLAIAVPAGAWAIGLAGSYRYNASYDPIAPDTADPNPPSLTPGSEFRVRLGLDRLVGQGRLTAGVTYSTFSQDEFGADRASPGPRIITQLSWNLPLGNNSASLYVWDVYRGAGDATTSLPSIKQNTIAVGVVGGFRMGRGTLRPALEFRSQSTQSDTGDESGTLIGVGAKYQWQVGSRMTVIPGARFDTGTIADIGFTGLSGSLGLRVGL